MRKFAYIFTVGLMLINARFSRPIGVDQIMIAMSYILTSSKNDR